MPNESSSFSEFVQCIVDGDLKAVSERLAAAPRLASASAKVGASRGNAQEFFFTGINHYLYAGDTALHMAAAAYQREAAEILFVHGAKCCVKNRRRAEPLHYAADANHWAPDAQSEIIKYLLSIGANPNATDMNGATPLHRAVRTRSMPAVQALLAAGANPRARNEAGSTPLHLAVQTTGRGGSGSEQARLQQVGIIRLLIAHGASPTDMDAKGRQVTDAGTSEWVRNLLFDVSP